MADETASRHWTGSYLKLPIACVIMALGDPRRGRVCLTMAAPEKGCVVHPAIPQGTFISEGDYIPREGGEVVG